MALNGYDLPTTADDAVAFMLGIAAGEVDEEAAETWIREHRAGRLTNAVTPVQCVSARGRAHTNLGHSMATWQRADFQGHLLAGIEWIAEQRPDRACTAERFGS